MNKRQPIETAPKDGTIIKVFCPPIFDEDVGYTGPARWNGWCWWKMHRRGFVNMRAFPTRWEPADE
jgi:hypothetical protein